MISYILALIHAYLTSSPAPQRRTITLGTRDSLLALAQTAILERHLAQHHPDVPVRLHSLKVVADTNASPLHAMPQKAIWTEELEALLISGDVDMIVHSLKDVPTTLPDACELGSITAREDPRDALIIREGLPYTSLAELPAGSKIGTSSIRRMAQIKRAYPHLEIIDLRGNIGTRCRKVDDESLGYTGAILAVAGLNRLDMQGRIVEYLEAPTMLHAVSQGAVGVEIRKGDEEMLKLLEGLGCEATTKACLAERSLLRTLEGGCSVPIGVQTKWVGEGELEMMAIVVSVDGTQAVEVTETGEVRDKATAEEFGVMVAGKLVDQGARAILDTITAKRPTTEAEL